MKSRIRYRMCRCGRARQAILAPATDPFVTGSVPEVAGGAHLAHPR